MFNPCVVIPFYNHERALPVLLESLRGTGLPTILVDDGSSAEAAKVLDELVARESSWVELVRLAVNGGKGAAVMAGVRHAYQRGFSHALQIDADGQHDVNEVSRFLDMGRAYPDDVICGRPLFDASAPRGRVWGRKLTNFWIAVNSVSMEIADGLCGFRLYPLARLIPVLDGARLGTRMDFDPEVLVRMQWAGIHAQNIPVKVSYPPDGVSHFRMGPDNVLISKMHTKMFFGMLLRLPLLLWRKGFPKQLPSLPPNSARGERGGDAQWSSMSEAGSVHGLQFLYTVYKYLGALPFRLVLYPVLLWFYAFRRPARRASRDYLTRVLGHPASAREGIRHFMSFADAMLDKLVAWNGGFSLSDVDFVGREPFAQLLAEGRGCLLIGSHLGNLEICRVLSKSRPNMELHVLVHTQHAQNFNRVLRRLDPESGLNLHQVTELDAGLAAWMSERIARGAVFVIAGDRIPVTGGRTVPVRFFGKTANFAQGPYLLAHALGCPVLLLFCVRKGKRFEAVFEPFADRIRLPRGAERERSVTELAQRYAERLETHAQQTPYQWFNFYAYWQEPALPQ